MQLVIQSHDDGQVRATWPSRAVQCAIGRSGIRAHKSEGDGATPAGSFAFRRFLYRDDRVARPRTRLPVRSIRQADGWCDDAADPHYNRPVRLPYGASAESLWRADGAYDIIVVIGYNDDPPVAGAGSAIFVHVAAPDYAPTAGCIALALPDLLALVGQATTADAVVVVTPEA